MPGWFKKKNIDATQGAAPEKPSYGTTGSHEDITRLSSEIQEHFSTREPIIPQEADIDQLAAKGTSLQRAVIALVASLQKTHPNYRYDGYKLYEDHGSELSQGALGRFYDQYLRATRDQYKGEPPHSERINVSKKGTDLAAKWGALMQDVAAYRAGRVNGAQFNTRYFGIGFGVSKSAKVAAADLLAHAMTCEAGRANLAEVLAGPKSPLKTALTQGALSELCARYKKLDTELRDQVDVQVSPSAP